MSQRTIPIFLGDESFWKNPLSNPRIQTKANINNTSHCIVKISAAGIILHLYIKNVEWFLERKAPLGFRFSSPFAGLVQARVALPPPLPSLVLFSSGSYVHGLGFTLGFFWCLGLGFMVFGWCLLAPIGLGFLVLLFGRLRT